MRFSFFARDLETGVRCVLHVFRTDRSPFDEFVAAPVDDSLELEVEAMTFEEYRQLVQLRFDAAAKVAQQVFYGRENKEAPSPLVFPVLADLVNTLGLNFGQRCVVSYVIASCGTRAILLSSLLASVYSCWCMRVLTSRYRWPFAKFIVVKREVDRRWDEVHLQAAAAEKEAGGPQNEQLKDIWQKQKAKAEDLEEKELLGQIAELYKRLEDHGWGEVAAEGMTAAQGRQLRVTVAELLRRVAWRGSPRGKNKWSWTKIGGKGAPGVFFATPEEASIYLLVKHGTARKALEDEAKMRKGKLSGATGKPEIDERLRKWGM
jgi:hypothetical protein